MFYNFKGSKHIPMTYFENSSSILLWALQAYAFYSWYACVTYFVAHPAIMLVCSVLISFRLLASQRLRGTLSASSSVEERTSSKELQASVTVVTLALLQCLVYVPCAVGCMPYCWANAFVSPGVCCTFTALIL